MQAKKVFVASHKSLEKCSHRCVGYAIVLGLVFLSPLFSLQVFLAKLFAFLTNGLEMKKISILMTHCEAAFESQLQLVLQLVVIFARADRKPSKAQMLSLSSSIVFMAKSRLEAHFAD